MASPRLLYYAEQARNSTRLAPAPHPEPVRPDALDGARGIATGVWLGIACWAVVAVIFYLSFKFGG
jgi:hypothetical protein